jgi:hypothetical protein
MVHAATVQDRTGHHATELEWNDGSSMAGGGFDYACSGSQEMG